MYRLNLGLIIKKGMAMRAKSSQNSIHFPLFIIELCCHARVFLEKKKDVEMTPTSSNGIRRIESKYTRGDAERRRFKQLDTSQVVDLEMLETETTPPS